MADRRSLIEGMTGSPPAADPAKEEAFVYGKAKASITRKRIAPRVTLNTRIRSELSAALKRASLERRLEAVEPNTVQEILEEVLEPWLRDNGYLG